MPHRADSGRAMRNRPRQEVLLRQRYRLKWAPEFNR